MVDHIKGAGSYLQTIKETVFFNQFINYFSTKFGHHVLPVLLLATTIRTRERTRLAKPKIEHAQYAKSLMR